MYYNIGLGDLITAYPMYQDWVRTFPLDRVAHNNFGSELFYLGRYDDAAAEAREAQRLMPMLVGPGKDFDQMSAEVYGSRLEEAKVTFSSTQARGFDDWRTHRLRHLIAFLQHDDPAMRQESEWLMNHHLAVQSLGLDSSVLIYYGHFNEARRLFQRAKDLPTNHTYAGDFRQHQLNIALQCAEVEDWVDAQR